MSQIIDTNQSPETKKFLEELFGPLADEPDRKSGPYILIWDLPRKLSQWVRTPDEAVRAAQDAHQEGFDTYVGVGLSPLPFGPHARCRADEIIGLVGLWCDIDIADPVHKKKNLPPDLESAERVLREVCSPTLVIHSGHGLQAWWLFKEPWYFETDEERRSAMDLAQRWNATLRNKAAAFQWDIDSTSDISRVLRIPGTWNRKDPDDPKPVFIYGDGGPRYDATDLDTYLVDTAIIPRLSVGPIDVDDDAGPPFNKWQALSAAEPKFKASWDRKRRDLQDQSPSSYDMSLATFAAQANWTDQEIANLIIAHRREHGDDLNKVLHRKDYLERTIGKARAAALRAGAAEALEEIADSPDDTTPEEKRRALLVHLSRVLGIEILQIVSRPTASGGTYRMMTPGGAILLGSVDTLLKQEPLRKQIADATKHRIPKFKDVIWEKISQALLDACEDQEVPEEMTERGQVRTWLLRYLTEHNQPTEDADEAIQYGSPYLRDGHIHLFGYSLRNWLVTAAFERLSPKEMGNLLRDFGATPATLNVTINGKVTTRSVWRLPPEDQW